VVWLCANVEYVQVILIHMYCGAPGFEQEKPPLSRGGLGRVHSVSVQAKANAAAFKFDKRPSYQEDLHPTRPLKLSEKGKGNGRHTGIGQVLFLSRVSSHIFFESFLSPLPQCRPDILSPGGSPARPHACIDPVSPISWVWRQSTR